MSKPTVHLMKSYPCGRSRSVATEAFGFVCDNLHAVDAATKKCAKWQDDQIAALGEPPDGYVRCWLETWPVTVLTVAPNPLPRKTANKYRVSIRGAACFVRADFVQDQAALGSRDHDVSGPEHDRLYAALLPLGVPTVSVCEPEAISSWLDDGGPDHVVGG